MKQKNILVTGGAQGIGKVICKLLSVSGYLVSTIDNDIEAIAEVRDELPHIKVFEGDVSKEEDVEHILSLFRESRLDGLVNNAAIGINKKVNELSLTEWNRVLAVNLTGPFLLAKYSYQLLKNTRGSIINIASTRALMSEPNTEAYSASKGGIVSLTHALAVSFAPYIRVNCISPGWIEVGNYKKKSVKIPVHHTETDNLQHPVGRVGIPEDIASMVEFLLSEKSGFITGQNFVVDGGMTKKMIYV